MQNFINDWQHKKFEWGIADCYTFTRTYIDFKFSENNLPILEYNNLKTAVLLNKKYSWIDEIKKNFKFEIINKNFEDGDLLIVDDDFQCAHLYYNNHIYSFDPELNFVSINVGVVKPQAMIRLKGLL
jgi:hypothetical protein